MKFKIWHKLALLLIAVTSLTAIIGIGLSQYSFKSGFFDYLYQQEQRRLSNLSNRLLLDYQDNGNWEFIRNNRRLWLFYLRPKMARFIPNETMPMRNRAQRPGIGGRRNLPPLALLDTNKKLIVGQPPSKEKALYIPLKNKGQIIAYLHSEKFNQITDSLDQLFATKQNHAFLINTALSLILSVIVALIVSFYFRKRIKNLTQIAKYLTSGQYQHRMAVKHNDELGQLGMDFNLLAETLQKNKQSQQQWIADISHELRTPVAILKGELEALEDGVRPLNKTAIKSLKQEIERLRKLIEDLYQLSTADIGALKYTKEKFIFDDLILEIKESFSARFKLQKLSLQIDNYIPKQFLFMGDKQRLYQLLSNLLENSLRYTDTGGQVLVTCEDKSEANNQHITILVEDSFPCIAEEKISHIFNRLYRLENSRNRLNGGAGLGLAIAKQIVIAHQGEIFAKPSKLGGIVMTCHLPK